ncbi:MAG: hypothetical protein AAF713_20835 [Pseudomonadota bacterium]
MTRWGVITSIKALRPVAVVAALCWVVLHTLMVSATVPGAPGHGDAATQTAPDLYIAGEKIVLCTPAEATDSGEADEQASHFGGCRWCRGISTAVLPCPAATSVSRLPTIALAYPIAAANAVRTPSPTASYASRAPPV